MGIKAYNPEPAYASTFGGMGNMGNMGQRTATSETENADSDTTSVTTPATNSGATSLVNYPIDTPTLGTDMSNLPMLNWIFESEEYTARYHELFAEFMEYFNSGEFASMYDNAIELITPYVEKDPLSFCTYDKFLSASATLRDFCTKRAESISLQLTGVIATTSDGQPNLKTQISLTGLILMWTQWAVKIWDSAVLVEVSGTEGKILILKQLKMNKFPYA